MGGISFGVHKKKHETQSGMIDQLSLCTKFLIENHGQKKITQNQLLTPERGKQGWDGITTQKMSCA